MLNLESSLAWPHPILQEKEGVCMVTSFTAVCSAVLYSAGPITAGPITAHGAVITASTVNYKV